MVRFASCESDSPALLASAGLRRQYIPVLLRRRGDPSPRPFGLFSGAGCDARHRERRRRSNGSNSVHPWTAAIQRQRITSSGSATRAERASSVAAVASAAGCRPNGAPYGAASRRRNSPKGGAQATAWMPEVEQRRSSCRMRASSLSAQGCAVSEPRSLLADPQGRMPGGRAIRGVLSLVTFFAQALRRRSGANSEAGPEGAKGRMPAVMPKSNRLAAGETKLCC